MTEEEFAKGIRRAARVIRDGLGKRESRAWRFGCDAGFRGQPTGHAESIPVEADRRDWLAGHAVGKSERAEFDARNPVRVVR